MYLPRAFAEHDPRNLHTLIQQHPLGTWITSGESGLLINHIPFVLDISRGEHGVLMGHVARANPVWQQFSRVVPSVVVFNGPQAYVSPSFYASKAVHGKVVPTWNYAVVHAHGIPRVVEDRGEFLHLLERLTEAQEAAREHPWKVSDAPAEFIEKTMQAIVGIEIPIDRLEGKIKNSQNRDNEDRESVAAAFMQSEDEQAKALARWMSR